MPTVETVEERLGPDLCPRGGCTIQFPSTAKSIACGTCGKRFELDAEPTPKEEAAALGAEALAPPEPTEPAEPAEPPAPAMDDEDDPVPSGAGDRATPAEARRSVKKRLPHVDRPAGLSTFIYQTREWRWVALGGKGNPYGPNSISSVIFEQVARHGAVGIDPVDLALELREVFRQRNIDCTSIIQRIVMVVERVCIEENVRLMERVDDNGQPTPRGARVRVREEHRGRIVAPTGMVGKKRAADLARQEIA